MKNRYRKICLALCMCLLTLFLCCCTARKGESVAITFTVTHSDGNEKVFHIQTECTNLADALKQEDLVRESESAGMYDTVDGETALWDDGEAWWKFSANGEDLAVGIESVNIADGDSYEAVFTNGFGE